MRRALLLSLSVALAAGWARGEEPDSSPTFYEHALPIFQRRCQVCHRPGAIGPFSLLDYEDAAGNSAMIEEVVQMRRMPPWHASPDVGQFANSRRLPDDEREVLMSWARSGAKRGDPALAPPPVAWPDPDAWRIGEPDAVVELPQDVSVPATGAVDYVYVSVPTHFGEDKWVRGAEIRVTAPTVVHHVLVFALYPDPSRSPRVRSGLKGYFASYLPGEDVALYPEGTGKWLPRGATLVFQLHYTPDGEAHQDRARIGLVFADDPAEVKRRIRTRALFDTKFKIPAGAPRYEVRAHYDFERDEVLTALLPHMHLRGRSFRYLLRTPDGRAVPLLDVPRYDFNWQNTYRLAEPLFVPRGSRMIGVATYDNSRKNRANPDPTRAVKFGEQTWDEMMIGYMDLVDATPEDRAAWEASQEGPR